ncbi:MAG: right-handed parallel beta-helix repeat-containing protein, partial [Duncaniella sp.]|nr:right-handed parallel beta-helix repeat-containing protein [Duncaniella sp.]
TWGDDEVIIDGSKMEPKSVNEFKGSRCMYFPYWANYWYVKGLIFQNAKDNGIKVEGSYNIFERCVFRGNNDTGLQIGMFKDWSIEEMTGFPISGTPEFNPGYTYCRGNKVINCDSYNNYDAYSFSGTDDGGDADGFACKLFPGPGTEFYGCRAWNNSDDNWDLYMVYHPVVIDNCWAWNAALDANGSKTPGNGNGFKLGGGGSSGGAAFDQSTGAHVVRNCVSFSNTVKGFDQNNAYEGMYLFNNVAWDNEYNYRFPTMFKFGGMRIRNCVGFLPRKLNHEFLSADKTGSVVPDTDFNSWTLIDGCDAYKDGNKVGKTKVYAADHTSQFLSLSEADAKAARFPDGSLPENNFARLVAGSTFVDKGEAVDGFVPVRFMTEAEAKQYGLELVTAAPITIEHNGAAPDLGAFESGQPSAGRIYHISGDLEQTVYKGTEIMPVTIKWGGAATDVTVTGDGIAQLSVAKDAEAKSIVITGAPTSDIHAVISTVGGETTASLNLDITVSDIAPATLTCTSGNLTQLIFRGSPVQPIVIEAGGGATAISVEGLPEGLAADTKGLVMTISGTPTEDGTFTVTATGGMLPVTLSGSVTLETPYRILTGDWYHIQDAYENIPEDLRGVVSLEDGTNYSSTWNPEYTENGSVPGGCTAGAVNVERGCALVWKLPSLLELKANIHFTGGRYLEVRWQYEGEAEHSWTSSKLSKTTLVGWDLLANAGFAATDRPVTVKFVNPTSNNGGIRVYDFFVKVHGEPGDLSGIAAPVAPEAEALGFTVTDGAIVVDTPADIAGIALYSLDGRMVASSRMSSILARPNGQPGVYILQVIAADGTSHVAKAVLR